jgi:quinol monooxygenase YgiN
VIFSVVGLSPSAKHRGQLVEILHSVLDLTRPSLGCLGCWLCEEDCLDNVVRYVEQWENEEALHKHIRSDVYRRLLTAMELSKEPPEVGFYVASERLGFELIEALRPHSRQGDASV